MVSMKDLSSKIEKNCPGYDEESPDQSMPERLATGPHQMPEGGRGGRSSIHMSVRSGRLGLVPILPKTTIAVIRMTCIPIHYAP